MAPFTFLVMFDVTQSSERGFSYQSSLICMNGKRHLQVQNATLQIFPGTFHLSLYMSIYYILICTRRQKMLLLRSVSCPHFHAPMGAFHTSQPPLLKNMLQCPCLFYLFVDFSLQIHYNMISGPVRRGGNTFDPSQQCQTSLNCLCLSNCHVA